MEKQINTTMFLSEFSLSIQSLQSHLQKISGLLQHYSPAEINQMFPIVLKQFLNTYKFDKQVALQVQQRLKKFKLQFKKKINKEIIKIKKLKAQINCFRDIHKQEKDKRDNGVRINCEFPHCGQSFATLHGCSRHILRKHTQKKAAAGTVKKEKTIVIEEAPKKKGIKKSIKKTT